MNPSLHIPERYEFTVHREKVDGSVREVVVTFDLPVGVKPRGGVEQVSVDAAGRVAFAFPDGLTVAITDTSEKMLAAIAGASKVSIIYSLSDGSVLGTEIVRAA